MCPIREDPEPQSRKPGAAEAAAGDAEPAGAAEAAAGAPTSLPASPAAERNKEPIAEVLSRTLPGSGLVLEVASGTGQHVIHFARVLPGLVWQPSDAEPRMVAMMRKRVETEALANLRQPLVLDARASRWPMAHCDAVVCINMIHIAPWSAAEGLVRGCARVLPRGGILYLYGPYRRGGAHTAPSNEAFDADLRSRDSAWGVRDLEAVTALAEDHGLAFKETVAMPANNMSVIFVRI